VGEGKRGVKKGRLGLAGHKKRRGKFHQREKKVQNIRTPAEPHTGGLSFIVKKATLWNAEGMETSLLGKKCWQA